MSRINEVNATIPVYHSIRETQRITGLSECFIRKMCKQGKVPGIKSGKKFLVNVPSFLKSLETSSKGEDSNG